VIEIEFSAIARLCLNRRIPTQAELEREVLALIAKRNEKRIKINWQFSIQTARTKFGSHYDTVRSESTKYHISYFPEYLTPTTTIWHCVTRPPWRGLFCGRFVATCVVCFGKR
jgi:hypothetical protein